MIFLYIIHRWLREIFMTKGTRQNKSLDEIRAINEEEVQLQK